MSDALLRLLDYVLVTIGGLIQGALLGTFIVLVITLASRP